MDNLSERAVSLAAGVRNHSLGINIRLLLTAVKYFMTDRMNVGVE